MEFDLNRIEPETRAFAACMYSTQCTGHDGPNACVSCPIRELTRDRDSWRKLVLRRIAVRWDDASCGGTGDLAVARARGDRWNDMRPADLLASPGAADVLAGAPCGACDGTGTLRE